jgi:ABC-2 type transport system ATP-binding protein
VTTHVLALSDVTYTYPAETAPAVAGIDLTVEDGQCLALLGPNGAGKTTLVRTITGLARPERGDVRIVGGDPSRATTRRHLGVMLQDGEFPRHLRVRELVEGAAVRAGLPAQAAVPVFREVGIDDLTDRRAAQLSGGQRRRVHLARALVTDPSLLVLDEPTVGLDGDARRAFWQRLADRRDRGMAVLLTTHNVEEVAAVADRVAVIAAGRMVADTDPAGLVGRMPDRVVTARTALSPRRVADLAGDTDHTFVGGVLRVNAREPEQLLRRLLDADPALSELRVTGASLEEAVLAVASDATTQVAVVALDPSVTTQAGIPSAHTGRTTTSASEIA